MHRFIFTLNLLLLSCLWYLHNLFLNYNQEKLESATIMKDIKPKRNKPLLSYTNSQYMRFSNVTYFGRPKKILYATYIYELIDPTISTMRYMEEKKPKSKSLQSDLFSTELNRNEYTRLWLESMMALQKE
ncbi:uncharacterized protein LOC123672627 [Harmonia axyridis]|uniref:uncharacterized protein LOC123672627 n=1 Tax=Harmonia axyridis TaxID=115357 RepID=UPI001E27827B|nr:uncharacterized protein LOC123672627 [Harmonia axyridis]